MKASPFFSNQIVISDKESPRFKVCPSNQTISTEPGQATAVVIWGDLTATDNSNQEPNITCVPTSGTRFQIGEANVLCQAQDMAGNLEVCNFVVDVMGMYEFKNIQLKGGTAPLTKT